MTTYDTVLFDNDGVLVTPPAYETQAEATRTAFESVGVLDVEQRFVHELVTGVTVDRLNDICEYYDIGVEKFWDSWERHDERSQFASFESGDRYPYDDTEVLRELSQTLGVVSNNHHSTIEFVLDYFDFESEFDAYYGREKTIESLGLQKPNTHYLDRALDSLEADSAIYVGDSESDVIAARRAGVDSVFIRRPHCADLELTPTPTYEVSTLHDIVPIVTE